MNRRKDFQLLLSVVFLSLLLLPTLSAQSGGDFIDTVAAGKLDAVRSAVAADASLPSFARPNGMTGLIQACMDGNLDIARFLVGKGASLAAQTKAGWFPLNATIRSGNDELLAYILGTADGLKTKDRLGHNGWTPLSMAAAKGELAMVKALMVKKAAFASGDGWQDLLKMAAYSGSPGMVEYALAQYKAEEIAAPDGAGFTALHYLTMGYWFDARAEDADPAAVAAILLERGLDTAIAGANGKTAPQMAAEAGRQELVDVFSVVE